MHQRTAAENVEEEEIKDLYVDDAARFTFPKRSRIPGRG